MVLIFCIDFRSLNNYYLACLEYPSRYEDKFEPATISALMQSLDTWNRRRVLATLSQPEISQKTLDLVISEITEHNYIQDSAIQTKFNQVCKS